MGQAVAVRIRSLRSIEILQRSLENYLASVLFFIDTYVSIDQYSNDNILTIRKAVFCKHENKNKTGEERVKV
jgi:hypothetical protein